MIELALKQKLREWYLTWFHKPISDELLQDLVDLALERAEAPAPREPWLS